jgi:hypothetical protein
MWIKTQNAMQKVTSLDDNVSANPCIRPITTVLRQKDTKLTEIMPKRKAARSSPIRTSAQRFREVQRELQQLDYFLKGTVLKRMMKCGQAQCACHRDPAKRHGPYFELTYKAKGKTVNVKLSPQAAPLYQAATQQHRKLKAILARMERLSRTALTHLAKQAQQD